MDIETLIDRAKAKEPQALETLYNMYFPKMMGVCIKIIGKDRNVARDLVHDAFILAFASIHSLRDPERFGEWMTTIVRNVALKYREKENRGNTITLDSLPQDSEYLADSDMADSMVNRRDITDIMSLLPNGYGQVFRLSVIEGYSHKEIADMLGIEPHSSSSQLSRAKAMLRKMMEHRLLAAILAFIIAIPMYLFFFNEKPAPPELAESKGGKVDLPEREESEKTDMKADSTKGSDKVYRSSDPSSILPPPRESQAEQPLPSPSEKSGEAEIQYAQRTDTVKDSIVRPLTLPNDYLAMKSGSRKKKKWQLLAIGSTGPAVAQNIYKIFTTRGNDGIGSEAPTIPEHISTWEDYAQYLRLKEHDGTPIDTLTLTTIAYHNEGEIIEHEHHDRPITFGLSLNKAISDRWSMETGLQYSLLKSKFTMGKDGYYVGKEQKIHYLGIPLRLSYRFADYKRLSAYGTAGLSLNIPIYGSVDDKYVVDGTTVYTERQHITPPLQWSTSLSIGVQYNVLPNISLYVEPTLYWHIPNGSSTHTIWTERPFVFSSPFGIRFTFK